MPRLIFLIALVSASLVVSSCDSKEANEVRDANNAAKSLNVKLVTLFAEGKAAVVKAAVDQAADLGLVIGDFKIKATKLGGEKKANLEAGIKRLEASHASLKQQLDQLTNAEGEGWKEIATTFDGAVSEMRKTIDELRAGFNK